MELGGNVLLLLLLLLKHITSFSSLAAIIHPQGVTLPPTQSSNETLINATTTVLPGNATNVTPTVGPTQPPEVPVYQGVAFFVQNILIFFR